ncbi:ERAD-associated E3 ubiquitin-protein ligase HRD1 [Psilocybe cubensis]|uniref:ERAD-associated E3 ubiquitin-protein ligase HRD1 n=2 Tax=Psilocybe cubensis TaxID=181762 RepID=A0ACB8HBP3_PSICU|nr:ERAD-associated E3 ubiquitin-protein ligase HRD1 [Psilocybe cubensis]KAH9485281.1 ERAD-associated E3 ubiquitin-protein ligase HRD1 [Psilocybe cubensis]
MPGVNRILRLRAHDVANLLNAHRLSFYSFLSVATVSAVIINALKNYSNFYSVAIYLSKSSRSVLVLANFGVLLTLVAGHIVQRIFFGSLRANEVERLYDRLWFFITESLLAFTIFRDEFDASFALMFGFLLFVKSFHWLASDRIEWMDQRPYPGPPLLFHIRMTILFTILWLTDCVMFLFAVEHTLSAGVGGMVLFASEYGILMASVINTNLKYLLSAYDLRRAGRRGGENAPPWENKSMWIFYIELATDFLKLTTYLVFFIIIITFYGLPLNIIRDVYITARSFITRLRALHRYQTATRNMDQRYPNATEEELIAMSDRTCIICREEMVNGGIQDPPQHPDGPNTTPKKLPCGHIFHFYCLRSWLERQQSCPTCRRNVLEDSVGAVPNPGNLPPQPLPGQQPLNRGAPFNFNNRQNNAQGGNHPLGFIGRYMGLPHRPANEAPNRQAIPDILQNQGHGNDHAPGIVINYQVQYQLPRPNDADNGAPLQQQQRLPVPTYAGFPGPGGVWQPWPAEGPAPVTPTSGSSENFREVRAQQADSETHQQSILTSAGPSTPTTATSSNSTASFEPREAPSAREAAVKAALNRFNNNRTEPSAPKIAINPPTATSSSSSPANPTTNSMPSTTIGSESNAELRRSPENSSLRPLPTLIPLFDFRQGVVPRPAPEQQSTNQVVPQYTQTTPRGPLPARSSPMPTANTSMTSIYGQQRQMASPDTSASQLLPPILTDEQLSSLDTVTRDSIDERLRILEGVSVSVYRCIDDLMRLRSALPTVNATVVPTNNGTAPVPIPATQHSTSGREVETTSSSRGKEKMREPSVEDSDPGCPAQSEDSNPSNSN